MDFETLSLLGYLTVIGGAIYMLQNGFCNGWGEEIGAYTIPDSMYKRYADQPSVSDDADNEGKSDENEEEADNADDESEEHMETDSIESQEIAPAAEPEHNQSNPSNQSHED